MTRPMAEIDKQLWRYALAISVSTAAIVLGLMLGGCVHELKFLPQCDGEPAKQFPCIGMCQVRVDAKVPTVRIMPNALVIKDHTGQTRCQEVS